MNLPSIVHHTPALGQGTLSAHGRGHYRGHSAHSRPREYAPRPPAPPPSPPVEDTAKCSLPSISTLLVYADGAQPHASGSEKQENIPPRVSLPPTPPMRPDSVFEGGNSPTMPSSSPASYYYTTPKQDHRSSYPPSQKPIYPSPTESSYSGSQNFYPPQSNQYKHSSIHQLTSPLSVSPQPTSLNPWTHHHHQSPASQAAFPQSQDRYICQTCNKAFSRPSSLRIHSHSHTGEKPFKCPHHGCGKAFSVRSNMKRHERGCHQ